MFLSCYCLSFPVICVFAFDSLVHLAWLSGQHYCTLTFDLIHYLCLWLKVLLLIGLTWLLQDFFIFKVCLYHQSWHTLFWKMDIALFISFCFQKKKNLISFPLQHPIHLQHGRASMPLLTPKHCQVFSPLLKINEHNIRKVDHLQ